MTTCRVTIPPRPITGLEFSPEEVRTAAREKRLLSLELEMTRTCNLRCPYCYAGAGQPMADEMQFPEIMETVRQAADLGARKIIILGGGEPCAYPRLRELIEHLSRLGLGVELFTNCTLMSRDLATFLFDRRVSVVAKRNSLVPAVQDLLAGVPGAAKQIEEGLALLLAAGYPDADRGLGVQTVICRPNLAEIPDLWRWTRSLGAHPYFEPVTPKGRATRNPALGLWPQELGAIFRKLSEIDRLEYGLQWRPHPPLAGASCTRHLYSLLVKANGDFCPCVGIDVALGNIRRDRLADVVRRHPVIDDMRNIHERVKGRCRSCRLSSECYGCRGNAFQLTGDYLAADPCCWIDDH